MRLDGRSQQAQLARDHGDVAVVVTPALPDGQALVALDHRIRAVVAGLAIVICSPLRALTMRHPPPKVLSVWN